MYPDWPQSPADLVPLPLCHGPKLKPFDFQGPQKIDFLDHIGLGMHAHVFKVVISDRVYALKLVSSLLHVTVRKAYQGVQFRFIYDQDWCYDGQIDGDPDRDLLRALYPYSEPFSAECRAFARIIASGHEEVAARCFGYLLLDEEHERVMMDRFSHLSLDFNGNGTEPGLVDQRSRFPGRDGRPPPLRGIVKAFGRVDEPLRTTGVKRLLRDVIQMQQLGIVRIDVAHAQLVDGKIADFSTAITTPHFITTPEIDPCLTPERKAAMEYMTFQLSVGDFWYFNAMVNEWNKEQKDRKDRISVYAIPRGGGCRVPYNLRSRPSRERLYSLANPTLYDWRTSDTVGVGTGVTEAARRRKSRLTANDLTQENSRGAIPETHRRVDTRPPRWYYECDAGVIAKMSCGPPPWERLIWGFKDGTVFLRRESDFRI